MDDYIPRKDTELVAWSANFTWRVAENATAWDIPADEVSKLQAACDEFAALHTKADSPVRTSVIVAEKNAARKTLIANIRALTGFRLKNPVISSAARIALGLRVRDTTLTTVAIPSTRPELDVEVLDVRRLKVFFHDMGASGRAKPRGISGAVVAFALLDAPPSDVNALTRSILATRTPCTLESNTRPRSATRSFVGFLKIFLCIRHANGGMPADQVCVAYRGFLHAVSSKLCFSNSFPLMITAMR